MQPKMNIYTVITVTSFVGGTVPCTRLIAFHEWLFCFSGEAIAENIPIKLETSQLHPQFLRGKAYHVWQVQQTELRLASLQGIPMLCTHIVHHILNLCVVKCCKNEDVNSIMQIAENVCYFFINSPKRQLAF